MSIRYVKVQLRPSLAITGRGTLEDTTSPLLAASKKKSKKKRKSKQRYYEDTAITEDSIVLLYDDEVADRNSLAAALDLLQRNVPATVGLE